MSREQTVGEQQVPERPTLESSSEETETQTQTQRGLSSIQTRPGARRTSHVDLLVIEAELVADGRELHNPAQPLKAKTAESFNERIEDTDLEPAWLRPWEDDE